MTVLDSSGRTVFATSAVVGYGEQFFTWSTPADQGAARYTLRVSAVDLAGNRGPDDERAAARAQARKKPRRRAATTPDDAASRPSRRSSSRSVSADRHQQGGRDRPVRKLTLAWIR